MVGNIGEVIAKVKASNSSWLSQTGATGHDFQHDFQYDHDADILYLSFGKKRSAFSLPLEESEGHVYLRIDTDTYKIVGIDVLDFRKGFLKIHPDAWTAFAGIFQRFGDSDWRFRLEDSAANRKIEATRPGPETNAAEYFSKYVARAPAHLTAR